MRNAATKALALSFKISVCAFAVNLLAGCILADQAEQHFGLALGRDDGEFAIAVCEPIVFSSAAFYSRTGTEPWVEFYTYDGEEVSLQIGDVISADTAAELGLPNPGTQPPLTPGTWIEVSLQGDPDGRQAAFQIPAEGISDGGWIRMDDTEYSEPCVD
jgi:hypothetical protein